MADGLLSVVIPASNEERLLPACLGALLASEEPGAGVEAVVVANGCRDRTAEAARGFASAFAGRGWRLEVVERAEGGKPGALDAGDAAARGDLRAYLDADVEASPPLLGGLVRALGRPEAAYASGRVQVVGDGLAARLYARAWARTPFMARGVPGCGLFAVNAAGRARWGAWPKIVSDDTFVRLHFAPHERHLVDATYRWPVVEGLSALARVRRRQDRGVREVAALRPDLLANEGRVSLGARGALRLALADPAAFAAYAGVALAARLGRDDAGWSRGR